MQIMITATKQVHSSLYSRKCGWSGMLIKMIVCTRRRVSHIVWWMTSKSNEINSCYGWKSYNGEHIGVFTSNGHGLLHRHLRYICNSTPTNHSACDLYPNYSYLEGIVGLLYSIVVNIMPLGLLTEKKNSRFSYARVSHPQAVAENSREIHTSLSKIQHQF